MILAITFLTLKVALVATVINFPFALLVGGLVGRKNVRGKIVLEIIVSLPLALPPVAVGY